MKKWLLCFLLVGSLFQLSAQETPAKKSTTDKQDWREYLFTGGTLSLGLYGNTFLVGTNPVVGYSVTNWLDAGVVINYNYTSYKNYNFIANNKLRQTIYGGGTFVKIYPVRFIFLQAQVEENKISQKLISPSGYTEKLSKNLGSTLIGGGYTSGRFSRLSGAFYYLSVLFDVSKNYYSPYADGYGKAIPIFRAGLQFPLYRSKSGRY